MTIEGNGNSGLLSSTETSDFYHEDQLLLPVPPGYGESFEFYQQENMYSPAFRPFDFISNNIPTPISQNTTPKKPSVNTPRTPIGQNLNLFEATYANVQVYELTINDTAVMRRKNDDFINATHILKAAGYDKGPRTKILEKEVHHEEHEKIQGGYGRYQGTWIPIERARQLANDYNIYDIMAPILDL